VYGELIERDRRDSEKLDEAIEDMRSDAEEMQERSEQLGKHIEETRSDWHSKQQDAGVPGAQSPVDDEAEERPPSNPA
jgi:prefoldin subunit 5